MAAKSMQSLREDQYCSLCSEKYDREKYTPKVLNCGHTFCLHCISELIIYLEVCPTCNEPVAEPISNFPTNLALLEVEEEPENLEHAELRKKLLIDFINRERQRFEKNLEIMKKSGESLNSCLDEVNKLGQLQIEDPRELYERIKEVEQRIRTVDFALFSCYKPYLKADFSLRSVPTKEDFINKIVVELLRGKEIHAFNSEWYNDDIFWARLRYKDGKLYIHSGTPDLPTVPTLFVPFIDLKNCLDSRNFQTFLNIGGNQIICNMVSSSSLSYDFIKLCSGENGISFKGMTTKVKHFADKRQNIISLKIDVVNYDNDQSYDALDSLPLEPEIISKERLRIEMWKDECEIVENLDLSSSKAKESDGVVVAFATCSAEALLHLTEEDACVEDSGLILLLPSEQQNKP